MPILGVPKGPRDVAFTYVNDAAVIDDRFATLKYKRQQQRTVRETKQKLDTATLDQKSSIRTLEDQKLNQNFVKQRLNP